MWPQRQLSPGVRLRPDHELDGDDPVPCASPQSYPVLPLGVHVFRVRAVSAAGVVDPLPQVRPFTILCTPPVVAVVAKPDPVTSRNRATVTWTSAPIAEGFECARDGGAFAACASPTVLDGLGEGHHVLQVRAAGLCPNPNASRVEWTVDRTAPTLTIDFPAEGATTLSAGVITYTSTEAHTTLRCTLDGTTADCDAAGVSYHDLDAGPHTFSVVGTDAAQNAGAPVTRHFDVAAGPPVVTVNGPTGLGGADVTVTFTVSGGEGDVTTTDDSIGPSVDFAIGPNGFCNANQPCPADSHCGVFHVCEAPAPAGISGTFHLFFSGGTFSPPTPGASFTCSISPAGTCAVSSCGLPFLPDDRAWPPDQCTATYTIPQAGNYTLTVNGVDCNGTLVSRTTFGPFAAGR